MNTHRSPELEALISRLETLDPVEPCILTTTYTEEEYCRLITNAIQLDNQIAMCIIVKDPSPGSVKKEQYMQLTRENLLKVWGARPNSVPIKFIEYGATPDVYGFFDIPVSIHTLLVDKIAADSFLNKKPNTTISNPSLSKNACADTQRSPITATKKTRGKAHKQFYEYVKFHAQGESFKSWLETMNEYVFNDEADYKKFCKDRSDNSHDVIKNVALIKNGQDKSGNDNYLVAYKIVFDSSKRMSSIKTIAHRSVENYFNKARRR